MIKFLRKKAPLIGWIIVLFFAATMFTGTFFLRNMFKSSNQNMAKRGRQDFSSEIAVIGNVPVSKRKFSESQNYYFSQIQAMSSNAMPAPEMVERIQYMSFIQALRFTILLQGAEQNKLSVNKSEIKGALGNFYTNYNLKDKKALKAILKQNNYPYKQFITNLKEDLLVNKTEQLLQASEKVTDQDIDHKYTEVKARHVLITLPVAATSNVEAEPSPEEVAFSKADKIYNEIQEGMDFSEAAIKYSEDFYTKVKGGELGWIKYGTMVPEFEKTLFQLEKHEVSRPIKTQYGIHLIKAEDKKELPRPKDFDIEKEKEELLSQKRFRKVDQFIGDYMQQNELEIMIAGVKASYAKEQGDYQGAINEYNRLISENPDSPIPHYLLGRAYMRLQSKTNALREFERAAVKGKMNPEMDIPNTHIELAKIYQADNQTQKMAQQFDKAMGLAKDDLSILKQLDTMIQETKDSKRKILIKDEIARVESVIAERAATQNNTESINSTN